MKQSSKSAMLILLTCSFLAKASEFQAVDNYKESDELTKTRTIKNSKVDQCIDDITQLKSFSDSITNSIDFNLKSGKIEGSYYSKAYGLVSYEDKNPVGLFSHRHCELDQTDVEHLFANPDYYPKEKTYKQVKRVINLYNAQFDKAQKLNDKISEAEKKISSIRHEISKLDQQIAQIEINKKKFFNRGKRAQERLNGQIEALDQQKSQKKLLITKNLARISEFNDSKKPMIDEVKSLYKAFFGCLSYTESLSDPDTPRSYAVFNENVSGKFQEISEKPSGVKYYIDRPNEYTNLFFEKRDELLPVLTAELIKEGKSEEEAKELAKAEASKQAREYAKSKVTKFWLGVGLYQFTTKSGSSVQPCMEAWNKRFASKSSCQLKEYNEKENVLALGSSMQAFNAFCGIHRIRTQFDSMVNTTRTTHTAIENQDKNGNLKKPGQRCVSLFAKPGKVFVHYSPLGNLIHTINNGEGNLGILMSCVDSSLNELGK